MLRPIPREKFGSDSSRGDQLNAGAAVLTHLGDSWPIEILGPFRNVIPSVTPSDEELSGSNVIEAIATTCGSESPQEMCKYFRNDSDTTFEQSIVMCLSATLHSYRY